MVCVGPNRYDYEVEVGSGLGPESIAPSGAMGAARFRLTFNPNQRTLQFSRVERTPSGDVLEKFEPHRGILLNFVEAFAASLEESGHYDIDIRPDPDDRVNPDLVVEGYATPGACSTCIE